MGISLLIYIQQSACAVHSFWLYWEIHCRLCWLYGICCEVSLSYKSSNKSFQSQDSGHQVRACILWVLHFHLTGSLSDSNKLWSPSLFHTGGRYLPGIWPFHGTNLFWRGYCDCRANKVISLGVILILRLTLLTTGLFSGTLLNTWRLQPANHCWVVRTIQASSRVTSWLQSIRQSQPWTSWREWPCLRGSTFTATKVGYLLATPGFSATILPSARTVGTTDQSPLV